MEFLYHITTEREALEAKESGEYVPAAFSKEGFIHCSFLRQVQDTANRIFRGKSELVLLEIDQAKLTSEVRVENLEGGEELYPHVYGKLPFSCVLRVIAFPCQDDGSFGELVL